MAIENLDALKSGTDNYASGSKSKSSTQKLVQINPKKVKAIKPKK